MAQLHDLPKELLDMIADELRHNSNISLFYKDLKNLSLTSQQLRLSAQEALYRSIVIRVSGFEYWGGEDHHKTPGWSSLGCLVRTLLRRPDLAYMVRKLNVSIAKRTIGHKWLCGYYKQALRQDSCSCDWNKITKLCENFLKRACFSIGPGFNNTRWVSSIRNGEQLAVLGVILASTPKLQALEVNMWSGRTKSNKYDFIPQPIGFQQMFGSLSSTSGFSISWIPGLANLHSLTANCLLPQQLLSLPKLTFLKFGLHNRQWNDLPDGIDLPSSINFNGAISTVTRMAITLDMRCVTARPGTGEVDITYVQQLARLLPELNHLDLVIERELRSNLDYELLTEQLTGENIETLVIDSSAIYDDAIESINESYNSYGYMRWAQELAPIKSLVRFTKLRKIVAAQEAFFSVNDNLVVCQLPASIEEIGIVETSCAVERWLKYIPGVKWKYPNLKVITLWNRDRDDDHYDCDPRLCSKRDFPWEDEESEDEDRKAQNLKEAKDGGEDGEIPKSGEVEDGADEDDDTVSDWSSESDPPSQWKKDFVAASRDALEAAGIELTGKYQNSLKWTDF